MATPKKNTETAAPAVAAPANAYRVSFDAALPESKLGARGAKLKYPFEALPEPKDGKHASFPIFDRNAKQMQSTVYSAVKRFGKLDEAGKLSERVRDFKAVDVDPANDPDGAMCRVFRTK